MSVPPPISSPVPPDPGPESPSGARQLTVAEARRVIRANRDAEAAERRKDEVARKKETKTALDRNLVVASVAAVSIAFGAFFALRVEAKDISDGGVKQSAKDLAAHIELENEKFKLLSDKYDDLKSDTKDIKAQNAALLNRFRIPDPAPEPKDGGRH